MKNKLNDEMAQQIDGGELTLDEIGDAVKNGAKVALVVSPTSESSIGVADARRFAFALKTATLNLARLRKLVYAGAKSRWGELKDCVVDRLEFELESIDGFGGEVS